MSAPLTAPLPNPQAFTVRYPQKVPVLCTDVEIFPAFQLGQPVPAAKKYNAVYDTGAMQSAISPTVVNDLGLPSIGAAKVGTAAGPLDTTAHLINIGLPNKVMFQMVRVTKANLNNPFDVLIGMDILGTGDFAVTHHQGKTTFSFRWPSHDEIDFVAQAQAKPVPAHSDKVSRNSQCPCGSGKKYKRCCGT
jgi:hypothetical protein